MTISGIFLILDFPLSNHQVGDKVCVLVDQKNITGKELEREWLGGDVDGVLATHAVFPEEGLLKFPEHLSWDEVCA